MSKTQRTVTIALWMLVVASLLGVLAMQRWAAHRKAQHADVEMIEFNPDRPTTLPADPREPLNLPAPSFNFIDHAGKPFSSETLKGKVWTFSLFFSECQGICPGMRETFETVQSSSTSTNVHFVLLTVDPERDTPEKLAEYARVSAVDMNRSHLLTGPLEEIQRVARQFLIPFDLAVNHSGKVMLVDQTGMIRSFYTGTDAGEMKRLAEDIKALEAESR